MRNGPLNSYKIYIYIIKSTCATDSLRLKNMQFLNISKNIQIFNLIFEKDIILLTNNIHLFSLKDKTKTNYK